MDSQKTLRKTISKHRDGLMGLSILGVVLFHISPWFNNSLLSLFAHFGLWGVDVFLFLSGFGCVFALKKYSIRTFWIRRILRILPTCFIVGSILLIVNPFLESERFIRPLPIRMFSLHRWYIQAILFGYLLCPLFTWLISKYKILAILIIVICSISLTFFISKTFYFRGDLIFPRIPVFCLGIYVALFDIKITILKTILFIVSLCLAIGFAYFSIVPILKWSVFLAFSMPLICLILSNFCDLLSKVKIINGLLILGNFSLEIYLIHEYLAWSIEKLSISSAVTFILFITLLIIGCFILKKSTDKLIVLNYIKSKLI